MKKLIYLTMAFVLMLMFIGCYYTMTPEQRQEQLDLRGTIGDSQFVGPTTNRDAVGMTRPWW